MAFACRFDCVRSQLRGGHGDAVFKNVHRIYAKVARFRFFQRLRYFNVFGPRQDPNGAYAAVIPKWIAAMIRNGTVHINGDGQTARDFCYVENAVQANLLAATVEDAHALNHVYNVALNERTSLVQLFQIIRDLLCERYPHLRALQPVHLDFRRGDVRFSQADIGKAQRLLGYQPLWRVEQGLARAIDWYVTRLSPIEESEAAPVAERTARTACAAQVLS